jgi:hypothetical protein
VLNWAQIILPAALLVEYDEAAGGMVPNISGEGSDWFLTGEGRSDMGFRLDIVA